MDSTILLCVYLRQIVGCNNKTNKLFFVDRQHLDIDECDYSSDVDDSDRLCPDICRNTIGSYVCVDPDEEPVPCQPGYDDEDQDGHCHGILTLKSSSRHIC